MTEDQTSTKPAERYLRIADHYANQIIAGLLKPGEKFPTRHQLMERHGENGKTMGRATADKIIDVLCARNMIERHPRQAPTVADRSAFTTTPNDRIRAKRATGEALAEDETSKILEVGMITCPPEIAAHLGVEPGDPILRRSRVNFKNGAPATMSTSYYTQETAEITPELAEPIPIHEDPRDLAAERLGSPLTKKDEVVTSRVASEAERRALLLPGTLVVVTQVMRVVPLEDGRVIEVVKEVTPGNRPLLFSANYKE